MNRFTLRLAVGILTLAPTLASAQVASIPGISQNGAVPTGFQAQGYKMDCNNATPTSGQCWPLMEIWDATTQASVNATDKGLTTHLGGSGAPIITGTAWASGTTNGTTQAISTSPSSANAYLVQLDQGSGFTAGAITFQTSGDGTNWTTINAFQVLDPSSANGATIPLPYTLVASTNKQFLIFPMGSSVRLAVSTTTAGGTVTPFITAIPLAPNLAYPQATSTGAGNGLLNVFTQAETNTGGTVPAAADYMGMLTTGNLMTGASGSVWGSSPTGLNVLGANVDITACSTAVCGLPTITSNALVFGAITSAMTGTTATSLIAAVTSQHIYVTSIACQNTSATVATLVQVLDGASTVLGNLAAGINYGGDNRQGSPPLFVTTIGNALEAKNVTTGASVTCNAAGYSSAN